MFSLSDSMALKVDARNEQPMTVALVAILLAWSAAVIITLL